MDIKDRVALVTGIGIGTGGFSRPLRQGRDAFGPAPLCQTAT